MSAEATFWAWMMGVKPASCKLVLLCLADCHNGDTGRCDPSAPYIADFTGLDKKTVRTALDRLVEMGPVSMELRKGKSPQYTLNIDAFPIPPRGPGERKKPLPISGTPKNGSTQNRVDPESGTHPYQNRVDPIPGTPETGYTQNREAGLPNIGRGVYPKTGTEPTSNLQRTCNGSVPASAGTAAVAALPVDNSLEEISLAALLDLIQAPEGPKALFDVGVSYLGARGIAEQSARSLIAKLIADYGEGRVFDAFQAMLEAMPQEPKPYLFACLQGRMAEIPLDWRPPDTVVAHLTSQGIPEDVLRREHAAFVEFHRLSGMRHHDWPRLFQNRVFRHWERSEGNPGVMRRVAGEMAGFDATKWMEPA